MACPACHRDDFANLQGFLNHCRISHILEFGPYEQVMLQCGTPVDESEVPMDHPARLRPVMNLVPSASKQSQKKLERVKSCRYILYENRLNFCLISIAFHQSV